MENKKNKGFYYQKIPPNDIELENKILCVLINDSNYYIRIATFFNPEIFYGKEQKVVAQAIYELNNENKPIDIITVTKKAIAISKDITPYDISMISTSAHNYFNVEEWFHILIEYHIRRKILEMCYIYQAKATDMTEDALFVISELAEQVSNISNMTVYDKSLTGEEAVAKLMDHIDKRFNVTESFRSIGNEKLDEYVYLDAGDIVMIGGPGGSGKSKLAMFMAKNLLLKYKDAAVQIFAFEDPSNAILKSWLSYDCMLTSREMDNKGYSLSQNDVNNIQECSDIVKELDFTIISNPCYINDIKSSFMNFCRKRPDKFNLLIIDNIMLLKDNDDKSNNNGGTSIDDKIARIIKEISIETMKYNTAIIFLHHFTKEASNSNKIRNGFRPEIIDVRGSTRYNDIALTTLLINKPSKHKELVSLYPGYEDMLNDLMIVEVAKSRNGKEGFVRMFTDLGYNIFLTANEGFEDKYKKNKKRK